MGSDRDADLAVVYVVDDEKIIASTLALILVQKGYRAMAFTNPLEAMESATEKPPSILIADVIMPDVDGIELAIDFNTRFPNCKILLLSGQAVTTDLLESARERGYDFPVLAKPIHPIELLAAITNLTTHSPLSAS